MDSYTMAEAVVLKLQDLIICSLCQETLQDPVLIPCGHNFCKGCITDYWPQAGVFNCPRCKEDFSTRPSLCHNTVLAEVIQTLQKPEADFNNSWKETGPGNVGCDACMEKKHRAVKSCLTCLASFCEEHIQPHYQVPTWQAHRLIDPNENLAQKLCTEHHKNLDFFCRTDEKCICVQCVLIGHGQHEVVEPEKERKVKQTQLAMRIRKNQKRIEERQNTVDELRHAVLAINRSADKEVRENEKCFTDLILSVEEACKKVTEQIREREKRDVEKAERLIERLEKEIEELKKRDTALAELSETDDHILFLQTFSTLCASPEDGESLSIVVITEFSSENLRKELANFKKHLDKINQWDFEKYVWTVSQSSVYLLESPMAESRDHFLQYACDLTLDPNTANKNLCLSDENKKVTAWQDMQFHLNHPDRFDLYEQVLCRESLSGTRCYWEVEWNRGADIAVAYKGIGRKGVDKECLLGCNDISWSLFCSDVCFAVWHNSRKIEISAPRCLRIGVYLDYPAGLLSFYSVSDTMTLLHRFQTTFTEPLCPGFSLYYPDSSVTICTLSSPSL
uniref:Tripartite motif-containing protein 16-like n=2 Tax=Erpetoichthys calabaricus TaxID=27687 RepID=A0A8C4T0C9_ERPCA